MARTFSPMRPGTDEEEEDEGITELEKFTPERIDAVATPANGFGILLLKAAPGGPAMTQPANDAPGGDGMEVEAEAAVVKDDGERDGDGENALPGDKDDSPDTGDGDDSAEKAATEDGETAVAEAPAELDPDPMAAVKNASPADRDAYIAALKDYRASEPMAKGATNGTEFLQAKVAWRQWAEHGETEGLDGTEAGAARWLAKHGTGPVFVGEHGPEPVKMDEGAVVIPSPEMVDALFKAEAEVYKRDISTADRKRLAAEHKALPDGSYPIETAGDLHNAAILARSGHGNVSGAKALIRRRAKELGVSNPLDDNNETKKDAAAPDEAKVIDAETFEAAEKAKAGSSDDSKPKCPMCKGNGKVGGNGMKCFKCKGKGFMKPSKAEKAAAAATEAVKAVVASGAITAEAGDALIAQITEEAAKAAGPGARPLPPEVLPVAPHREPDGTSTVEQLEPDAGLGTDPDQHMDHVPASVSALTMKQATYEVQRMHDATCAAYAAEDVLEAYPALKSVLDAVDAEVFTKEARDALDAGDMTAVAAGAAMAKAAQALAAMSPAAVADGRALLHKSFADMYPSEHITPQMGIKPGSFQRPYLSAGHAAENSGGWTVNTPPSSHVPEPQQFQRGNLTAGHQAPSPADHGPNNPNPPDAGGRSYYSTSEKDMAAAAMRSMHDHIQATYDGCCPMAPARTVLPPGMGATNTPSTTMPHAQGGVAGMNKGTAEEQGAVPVDGDRKVRGNKGMSPRKVAKMLERALRNAGTNLLGPTEVEAIIAAKLAPVMEAHQAAVAKMQAELDELGKAPDPNLAPVRGQMRAGNGTVAPVEKRSLLDEAQDARLAAAQRERHELLSYVAKQAESPDPNVRERARAYLDQLAAENGGVRAPA